MLITQLSNYHIAKVAKRNRNICEFTKNLSKY